MKTILIYSIILLSLLEVNAFAQKDGDYIKSPELDPYVGKWQWVSADGDSTVTIILSKSVFNLKKHSNTQPDINGDILIGWHEIVINGKIEQSSLKHKCKEFDYSNKKQTLTGNFDQSLKKIRLRFTNLNVTAVKNISAGECSLVNEGNEFKMKLFFYPNSSIFNIMIMRKIADE